MVGDPLPWFPFYVAAWMLSQSRRRMNYEQQGVYWTLLIICNREGFIPADHAELAKILDLRPKRFAAIWPGIAPSFIPVPGDPSKLINPRMDEVRADQAEKSRKNSENGKLGGRPRKTDRLTSEKPIESYKSTEDENTGEDSKEENGVDSIPLGPAANQLAFMEETYRTPDMERAVTAYFQMASRKKHSPWDWDQMKGNAEHFKGFSVKAVVDAFDNATRNGWQSVNPKEVSGGNRCSYSLADRKAQLAAERKAKGQDVA